MPEQPDGAIVVLSERRPTLTRAQTRKLEEKTQQLVQQLDKLLHPRANAPKAWQAIHAAMQQLRALYTEKRAADDPFTEHMQRCAVLDAIPQIEVVFPREDICSRFIGFLISLGRYADASHLAYRLSSVKQKKAAYEENLLPSTSREDDIPLPPAEDAHPLEHLTYIWRMTFVHLVLREPRFQVQNAIMQFASGLTTVAELEALLDGIPHTMRIDHQTLEIHSWIAAAKAMAHSFPS